MAPSYDDADYIQDKINRINATSGKLEGYKCTECGNKGIVAFEYEGAIKYKECDCMKKRKYYADIIKSGLKDTIRKYTFSQYIIKESWQQTAKNAAIKFITNHDKSWFYMGGQVGCGKTHLCTAIVSELLKRGHEANYMLWRDEVVPLKACVNDQEYSRQIIKLKEVPVLYIDDFFKTEKGKDPTPAEVNIAFELLNYRYNNDKLVTIISSEKSIDDLLAIDEAVGSRIYQRSKDYCIIVEQDSKKNYRLDDVK